MGRDAKAYSLVLVSEKQKYFRFRGLTRHSDKQKLFARRVGVGSGIPGCLPHGAIRRHLNLPITDFPNGLLGWVPLHLGPWGNEDVGCLIG